MIFYGRCKVEDKKWKENTYRHEQLKLNDLLQLFIRTYLNLCNVTCLHLLGTHDFRCDYKVI